MLTVLSLLAGIYFLVSLLLSFSIRRRTPPPSAELKVSLIIPARNEAKDLPRCLRSLDNLDYPPENLQIILVNHGSIDATSSLMRDFAASSRFPVIVESLESSANSAGGKVEALRCGIEKADGEVLVFTDAEARFQPGWLRNLLGFIAAGYDLIGGAVIIEGESGFAVMQRYDWLYIFSAGAGFAGLNRMQSAFGKNLAITRRLFDDAGGFPPQMTWTEDLDLVQRCREKGKLGLTLQESCAVTSLPPASQADFFRQRLRWLKGGVKVGNIGLAAMILALAMDIGLIAAMFLGLSQFLLIFFAKILSDWLLLRHAIRQYKLKNVIVDLPVYSLFSSLQRLALLFCAAYTGDLKWR